jgi:TetR/AcrR family transcriptional regulator, cholesterol catabolism regulator
VARGKRTGVSHRREELLQTAAQLFKVKGYNGTSMQMLADEMHLEKASLYHYVTGKEQLIFEILSNGTKGISERLDAIVNDESASLPEKLRRAIRMHVESVCQDVDASVSLVALSDGEVLSPRLRSRYLKARDAYEQEFRSIVEAGVANGDFRPCEVSITTKSILGMMGWLAVWYREGGRLTVSQIADEMSDMVLLGLNGRNGPSAK